MEDKKKIVVICGPTASGKTGLAIDLCEKFNGEVISADSMQVYKNLDIGTAKATKKEQARAVHHLVDFMEPEEPYNVQKFCRLAADCIDDITSRDKLPIIAGGTGLYLESLINGVKFGRQPDNSIVKDKLRQELRENGTEYMYNQLVDIDPEYAKTVHPNNTVRVLRAIEIYKLTGHNMSYQIKNSVPRQQPYDSLLIGLNFNDRSKLYDNINRRVDLMVRQGIVAEAKYVYDNRDVFKTSAAAIGYKEFFPYFENKETLEECCEKLKQSSRNYAKRQLTWFRRMSKVNWLYIDEDDCKKLGEELVRKFLIK